VAGTEAKAFSGTDDRYAQMLEEQEAKALQDAAAGTKDGPSQPGKCKDKRTPLDLPLKRSLKIPLPPPLTSTEHHNYLTVQVPNYSNNATMVT